MQIVFTSSLLLVQAAVAATKQADLNSSNASLYTPQSPLYQGLNNCHNYWD